jgi:hypothetical protein
VDVKRLTGRAIVLCVLAGCWPSASSAATQPATAAQGPNCSPHSGVSALDQYCSSLPGADGRPQPAGPGQRPSGPPLSATLPPGELRRLRADGPAARALLTVPSGRPASPGSPERRAADSARAQVERSAKPGQPTPVTALASAAPDVLGGAFRWGLLTSTLGIVGLAWLRFRARMR